jgi:hypothetical protein
MADSPAAKAPRSPQLRRRGGQRTQHGTTVGETLIRWTMFSVAFAVLPVAYNGLSALTRGKPISYDALLQNGELLLVSAGVAASAAGELFGRQEHLLKNIRLFLVGMSFITVCVASLWFADIATAVRAHELVDKQAIAQGSTLVFLCSVVCGGCCMALSRMERP